MIFRIVSIKCIEGREQEFSQICRESLIPINKEAGCIEAYFLASVSEKKSNSFAIVSVWKNRGLLENMKNSKQYLDLIQKFTPLIESVMDKVYFSDSEVSLEK